MSNIIYINPYSLGVACTDTAPTSVLIADDNGTDNSLTLQFETIAGAVKIPYAHGATVDISDVESANAPLAIPVITVLATSESSGGDATDTHSWTLSSDHALGLGNNNISYIGQTSETTEDIGVGEQFAFTYDSGRGSANLHLDYTGSNCGGSEDADRVTINLQA